MDIFCKCGHNVRAHNSIGCAWDEDCECRISQVSVLLTHITKLDAELEFTINKQGTVIKAARKLRQAVRDAHSAGCIEYLDAWEESIEKWYGVIDDFDAALDNGGMK